ncbi:MAG TPA: twin-arginine translocase TatA/TatE family subunit [Acidobacteriaceae bacterium]|jgi:sec-independent protein translocase protein TatB|nr:twin-arginine translocase TatA/TatE family subunit [Acidobacteriaceae bacterium]
MPSFSDSIFLFVLALLLFGPKKLPVLARELGKWVGEFRRASNEFKMQMEEELRQAEQADRQKQIAAMEAAAPVAPALEVPEHPHLPSTTPEAIETAAEPAFPSPDPLPIATSGNLTMKPPATGLPTARGSQDPLGGGLLDSIPEVNHAASATSSDSHAVALATEGEAHGG